jgi:hypothetical protein
MDSSFSFRLGGDTNTKLLPYCNHSPINLFGICFKKIVPFSHRQQKTAFGFTVGGLKANIFVLLTL